MISKKTLVVLFGIFLIAIFWQFSNLLFFPDASIVLQKGMLVKLQPKNSFTQKFKAIRDGLSKIEILLRTPGIKFENGDQVKTELMDENCEKILQKGELQKSFLNSDNLYEFKFSPIQDSKEKTFCLKLTFANKKENAKSIQIFTINDQENQPLSLRPVYKNAYIWQDLSELNQRISQYKPFFLKHYYLWFISLGFIILSISLVIILITL